MDQRRTSLVIDVRPGERVTATGPVTVELVHKSGQLARLRLTAAHDVRISKQSSAQATGHVPSMAT